MEEVIIQSEALRMMMNMEGWQVVEKHVLGRIADHREQLMHCKTWEEVLQHRAAAEALESVLLFISDSINETEETE